MKKSVAKWFAFILLLALILGLFSMGIRELSPAGRVTTVADYETWPDEIIEVAGSLPVQEGGRIKPLETRANFAMLQMRGDRKIKIENGAGEKVVITPTAWMLDLLFRPELAHDLPSFRVDDSGILKAVGFEVSEKYKRRDRFTYNEISPFLGALMQKAGDYQNLRDGGADLSPQEKQTIELATVVRNYFYLTHYFDFVRQGVVLKPEQGEGRKLAMSTVMATAPEIARAVQATGPNQEIPEHIKELLRQIESSAMSSRFNFHPLPPNDPDSEKWSSVGELIEAALTGTAKDPLAAIEDVQRLEELHEAYREGNEAFLSKLTSFRANTLSRAGEKAEAMVESELSYNRAKWFSSSLYVFGFGSLFLFGFLLAPNHIIGKVCHWVVWGLSILGLVLIVVGIIHRFLVIGRPPVTNLYETIPYITAGMLVLFLFTERMTRTRVALAVSPIVGLGGMVLATVFEVAAAADSLDPLVAVLRSNFWLTTHVLTVTYGYAAGLAAAVLGFAYIFLRALGLDGGDSKIRRSITRMTYGVICFTLVLSLIGTVLGGIWANYSWGRFWGWDPKENGALMIVLWSLFILHGRAAGLLREWGVNIAAAFGGVVVTFSWFHVNMLGTGLHSYGFTDGKGAIWVFYAVSCTVILGGILVSQLEKKPTRARVKDEPSRPAKKAAAN